jgi:hypothetical protein
MMSAVDRICRLLSEANEALETIGDASSEQEETLARVDALMSQALREAQELTRGVSLVNV